MKIRKGPKRSVKRVLAHGDSGISKGTRFTCGECGLSVIVDKVCACGETHDLVCCGQPMSCEM
jgi:hypothetical protein